MAASSPDPLDLIRSTIRSSGSSDHPLSGFVYLDQDSQVVDSISKASSVKISSSTGDNVVLDKLTPTRLARSKETLVSRLSSGSIPSPQTEPNLFFNIEAVLLAIHFRDERPGTYLAQTASVGVASFPALDRNGMVEYLLFKRSEWSGILLEPEHGGQSSSLLNDKGALPSSLADSAGGSSAAAAAANATAAAAMSSSSTSTKRPYVPNKQDLEFCKRLRTTCEVVLRTRNDALRGNLSAIVGGAAVSRVGSIKLADFASFRKEFAADLEAAKKLAASGGSRGGGSGSSAGMPPNASSRMGLSTSGQQARKQRAQDPILVISNSPTALLNMFNIKQFLEEGIFVPPEEARQKARSVAEPVVSITSRGGAPTGTASTGGIGIGRRLLVVDNAEAVNRLGGSSVAGPGSDPWNRVVAVFTTGQVWQFKSYKWSEPRDLFKNVMGVYVRWHNEPQNPNVRDWNVTELQVDRSKRHTDKQVVSFFWRSLESWTQRRKPHLVQ